MEQTARALVFYGGFLWLGFAVFHMSFWKVFDWKNELAMLMPVNRMIMQAADVCMIYQFIVFAYISFAYAQVLVSQSIGHVVLLTWLGFWILRAGLQFLLGSAKSMASNVTAVVCIIMMVYYAVPVYAVLT